MNNAALLLSFAPVTLLNSMIEVKMLGNANARYLNGNLLSFSNDKRSFSGEMRSENK